jgi:hypothetical protein
MTMIGSKSEPPICNRVEAFVRDLPYAHEQESGESFELTGVLAYSEPEFVRIVIANYCLTFDLADVKDAVRVPPENQSCDESSQIRLTLRGSARLLDVQDWTEFDKDRSGMRRPFAIAVRTRQFLSARSPDFQLREQEFFRNFEK